MCHYD
jgi:hypothetical protein